jgi:hypothetical protein
MVIGKKMKHATKEAVLFMAIPPRQQFFTRIPYERPYHKPPQTEGAFVREWPGIHHVAGYRTCGGTSIPSPIASTVACFLEPARDRVYSKPWTRMHFWCITTRKKFCRELHDLIEQIAPKRIADEAIYNVSAFAPKK